MLALYSVSSARCKEVFAENATKWINIQRISYHIEHIGSLIKINDAKKQFIGEMLSISKGIGYYLKFFTSYTANGTHPLRCHCREHYNHRIIPRRRFDIILEYSPIYSDYRSPERFPGEKLELLT